MENKAGGSKNQEAIRVRVEQWPFVSIPSDLVIQKGISDSAKVTYAALVIWGGMDGKAFPSRDKLAEARGVKRSTVYKHLQDLESAGWISRESKLLPTGLYLSIITVNRKPRPDIGTGGSRLLDGGVQISGLGGPDIGTHKENHKEKRKDVYTHPFDLSITEKDARVFALRISKVYPHGWGNGGTKHKAGLKQIITRLMAIPREDWDTIYSAAKDYGALMYGNQDQQFCPALWRWVEAESWREKAETYGPVNGASRQPAMSAEEVATVRRQAQIDQAAAAGVTLDPDTLEVTDWGPQGSPGEKTSF